MARQYLSAASQTLAEAETLHRAGEYPLTVRRSQEVVELSLKAALRFLGIEYPKEHDVSEVLLQAVEVRRLPEWFEAKATFMAEASSRLAKQRGPALYGDEATETPPSSLFEKEDAERALQDARQICDACRRLVQASES